MFVKGCPSTISFTSDELRAALAEYVNARLMPAARIRAARITINRNGSVELLGVVPDRPGDSDG